MSLAASDGGVAIFRGYFVQGCGDRECPRGIEEGSLIFRSLAPMSLGLHVSPSRWFFSGKRVACSITKKVDLGVQTQGFIKPSSSAFGGSTISRAIERREVGAR